MYRSVNPDFWNGKRVLLTGHTGFKGSWLSLWLQEMGATVRGLALDPPTDPAMFDEANVSGAMEHYVADIRNLTVLQKHFADFDPNILIHMAAQPIVRLSYDKPVETFETNVLGTVNVLEAAKESRSLRAIVNVTTDKCYENREWVWGYREDEPMGGYDPYSSSKACVELLSAAYRKSFYSDAGICMATARAGNVIGGGDWSRDRLLPDILRSIQLGVPAEIRNPKSIRPWQHVLEPLSGYLVLAECLFSEDGQNFAEGWNFGPLDEDARSVEWIVNQICQSWPGEATWRTQAGKHPHEANVLKLDISKARQRLGWTPRWTLESAIAHTIDWHRSWINGDNMREVSVKQINAYLGRA